jgi:hypothetical protein
MDTKVLTEHFIILRTLVGFLGEKPQFGWWDTNFLSKTSLQFLEITFPKSARTLGDGSRAYVFLFGKCVLISMGRWGSRLHLFSVRRWSLE